MRALVVLAGLTILNTTHGASIHLRIGPLLLRSSVRNELKLSEEQVKKIQALDRQMKAPLEKMEAQLQQLPPGERRLALQKQFAKINAELRKKLNRILNVEQQKRLQQIGYQQLGYQAFFDRNVSEVVRLNAPQQRLLRKIHRSYQQEAKRLLDQAKGDAKKLRQRALRLRELLQDGRKGMEKTFSAEQLQRWQTMTGAPFQFGTESQANPGAGPK